MGIVILGGKGFLGQELKKRLDPSYAICIATRYWHERELWTCPADDFEAMRKSLMTNFAPVIINCVTNYGRSGEPQSVVREANFEYPKKVIETLCKVPDALFINMASTMPKEASPYAYAKWELENWLMTASPMNFLNLKTEMFYGLENPAKNFVSVLISKGLLKQEPMRLTNGLQKRDFIHVDDVAGAVEFALDRKWERDNVWLGTGKFYSLRELESKIRLLIPDYKTELLWGEVPDPKFQPSVDVVGQRLQDLGWQAQWTLDSGLKDVVEKYRTSQFVNHI